MKILAALLLTLAFTPAAFAEREIVMGFNPAENAEMVTAKSQAFVDWFMAKTGLKVKTFIATDYTALIEAMRSNRVDFAWLPPFSYVKAEEIANAEVLLKTVRKGKAVFYSGIITRADRGYKKIQDLKGKTIAWVDPSSTSGHIYPKANLMAKYGINADEFFSKQVFAGAHDSLVLAVLNGTVDAGATFVNDTAGTDGSWHMFLKGDDSKKIKMIYVSDPIPSDTLATSKKYHAENKAVVDKTVAALIAMTKDPKGLKILQELYRVDGLMKAQSKDFEPVRKAARALAIMK